MGFKIAGITISLPNVDKLSLRLTKGEKGLKIATITLKELTWLLFFKRKKWLFESMDFVFPYGILTKVIDPKKNNFQ